MEIIKYTPKHDAIKDEQGKILVGGQYDDSITVHFENEVEKNNNKTVYYNDEPFFFGCSNLNRDGSYTALMWRIKPCY